MKNTHLISLLILCFANHALHGQTITTIAGNGTAAYLGNGGPAISAQVQAPARICTDTFGNIYFLDLLNSAVREIDVTGNINTIAGSATSGYSGDGGPAADAQLNYPFGIACDLTGNIYIADQYNHRIRKIDASSGLITTIAGNGIPGFSGDDSVATNAKLKVPASVALDDSGNIYIADQYNNRVRKVSVSNNIITTIAGTGIAGALGDGSLAVSAQLDSPVSVAVDHSYNVYIADYKNAKVRKIDAATKNISTFAGTGVYGYSGDHGLAANAKLELPFDLQTDIHSNLYIIDEGASVIRSVNLLTDTIVTIAGTGAGGYNGDGIPATSAELGYPVGACTDYSGNIVYIADKANSRIRKVSNGNTSIKEIHSLDFSVSPNPSSGIFEIRPTGSINQYKVYVLNAVGQKVYQDTADNHRTQVDLSAYPNGVYFICLQLAGEHKVYKVVVDR